jgi:hypothetical protein
MNKRLLKMEEFIHRTRIPLLPDKVNRSITPQQIKW